MITIEQGIMVMSPRINGNTKHEYYNRTVDRRKLYHAMMTGDDIEEYLTRFECREDSEQFKLRKMVTQQCVSPAINEAAAKFYKTSRYPNIKKELKYEKQSDRLTVLEERLNSFCYDGNIQSYLATEYDRRSLIDPNAFLVMDFTDYDPLQNERPGIYGVWIPCDNVIDFDFLPNDELNYLIISRQLQIFDTDSNLINLVDYIGYLGDDILIYEEMNEFRSFAERPGGEIVALGVNEYYVYSISSKAGQVQAFRIGYIKDPITNYQTCVSPLDTAETVVMDLNNDKSNYDQTKLFHCFPQKFQYVEKCPGESEVKTCNHGKTLDGGVCNACKGKGVLVHTSSSDVISLPMPKDAEDYVVPLAEMIHYAAPGIEIIKHLREDLEGSKMAIMRAIFTTESAVKADGGVKIENTATEFMIKSDDLNNILLPFCEHKSKVYKFIIRQIALFNDIADGLSILFEYPASLRLETVEELQAKFSTLVDSGASPTLLDDLEAEIASKRFSDDPAGLKRYNTWRAHRPYRNRTSSDVEFAIGNGLSPKWIEVLWSNYEQIMTELENEHNGFYDMKYSEQRDLIKDRANEYASELEVKPEFDPVGNP